MMTSMTTTSTESQLASIPTSQVGATVLIDAIDPPFSREPDLRSRLTVSIAGYCDAVIGMDEASGFATLLGRAKKDNPQDMVNTLVDMWYTKHSCLSIKTDDEFVVKADVELMNGSTIEMRQAPPYEHK